MAGAPWSEEVFKDPVHFPAKSRNLAQWFPFYDFFGHVKSLPYAKLFYSLQIIIRSMGVKYAVFRTNLGRETKAGGRAQVAISPMCRVN